MDYKNNFKIIRPDENAVLNMRHDIPSDYTLRRVSYEDRHFMFYQIVHNDSDTILSEDVLPEIAKKKAFGEPGICIAPYVMHEKAGVSGRKTVTPYAVLDGLLDHGESEDELKRVLEMMRLKQGNSADSKTFFFNSLDNIRRQLRGDNVLHIEMHGKDFLFVPSRLYKVALQNAQSWHEEIISHRSSNDKEYIPAILEPARENFFNTTKGTKTSPNMFSPKR